MLKNTIIRNIFVGIFFLLACGVQGGELAKHISIYKLIVTPEKYDNQLVMVSGYLGSKNGSNRGLFVNEIDALTANTANKINFDISEVSEAVLEKCSWSYATVVGNFSVAPDTGKLSFTSLRSVSSFDIFKEKREVKHLPCYYK